MRSRINGLLAAERQQIVAYSSGEEGSSALSSSGTVSEHAEEGTTIRRTLGNLDALLGIEEEVAKDKEASGAKVCAARCNVSCFVINSSRRAVPVMQCSCMHAWL